MSVQEQIEDIAEALQGLGRRLAVAESLTGGQLSAAFAAGPSASTWFAGGLVTYTPETKYTVLDVREGPVVTEEVARAMAGNIAGLLEVPVALSITGVGGPDEEEGKPPGTVWIALRCGDHEEAHCVELEEQNPGEILQRSVEVAVGVAHRHLTAAGHDD